VPAGFAFGVCAGKELAVPRASATAQVCEAILISAALLEGGTLLIRVGISMPGPRRMPGSICLDSLLQDGFLAFWRWSECVPAI